MGTDASAAVASCKPFTYRETIFRGQTLGTYKIIALLASGGFGAVNLAQDTWIDKKVAIKVPHRQNPDFGELLEKPRLLASLGHPNIAITTAEKQDTVFRNGVRAGRDERPRARSRATDNSAPR
jgi:serine/threonine protein kinase